MRVAGCDFSSRFVDIVTVPFEGTGQPVWHRFPLVGADAFDRARSVADSVPGRSSVFYEDILAVGIEHPAGKFGTGPLLRIQGAVLARIPARMLVTPLPPSSWRKAVGLPGNASKDDVWMWVYDNCFAARNSDLIPPKQEWPQDARDAYCIALATRSRIDRSEAA